MAERELKRGDRFLCELVYNGNDRDSDGDYQFDIVVPNMGDEYASGNDHYDYLRDHLYVHQRGLDKLIPIEDYNAEVAKRLTPDMIEAFLDE